MTLITLPLWLSLQLINSLNVKVANQLTGFYMMVTLTFSESKSDSSSMILHVVHFKAFFIDTLQTSTSACKQTELN